MQTKLEQCPDEKNLTNFLLGKLPRYQNESYESHIAECNPCVETIRNLSVDDTLDELMGEAWSRSDVAQQLNSESQFMDRLIDQMRGIRQTSNSQCEGVAATNSSHLQDRSFEVQRLFEPASHAGDLGQLDHYRIQELLGAGSSGVVFRAIDEQLQRTVAIKILRPSLGEAARERFVAEARATATIDHPNVITIYQVGSAGPLAYIAMQWLPGETLDQRLQRETALPVEEIGFLSRQISDGLSAAHAKGLIHRDIKPANIWLESDRTHARILDFGLVRITDEDPQLTCTGMIAGTPCYMSPEQSRGDDLDERSDIFSLGCLMYQALTGRLPFRSNNALATLQSIQRDQPTPPAELDPGITVDLSDLVMCLLEKSPNKRPSSAVAVAEAIDGERSEWSFPVDQYGSMPIPKRGLRTKSFKRKRGWVLAVALLALGFCGMLFGPQITRIVTNQGELTIESFDENIKIEILQNGELVRVIDLMTDQSINIVAGNYEIRPMNGDDTILIDKEKLTMSRGGKVTVKVSRRSPLAVSATDVDVAELTNQQRDLFRKLQSRVFRDRENAARLTKSGKFSVGYHVLNSLRSDIENSKLPNQITEKLTAVVAQDIDSLQKMLEPKISGNLKPSTIDQPYILDEGDLLGIYIEGVLGEAGKAPPVHYDPASGLPPCIGYPIPVRSDGKISLPLVEMVSVRGKTIEEVEDVIKLAYFEGASPLLIEDQARIIVGLMRQRDYFALPKTSATSPKAILDVVPKAGHQLDSGDIVGVFIDGVLGSFNEDPPIHYPAPETGLPPSIGFPIPVRADGNISLPLVEMIRVRGKTIEEVETDIKRAYYSGDQPILKRDSRILVNLMRVQPKANEIKVKNSQ